MTKNQIKKIIQSGEVPKEEFDEDLSGGYIFPFCIILGSGIPLLPFVKDTISLWIKWSGLMFGIVLMVYTYFSFKNERTIKTIITNLDKESNQKIVEHYFKKRNIALNNFKNYSSAQLPTLFYKKGLKAMIITEDNIIYFNIRNVGFAPHEGRTPYSIGKVFEEKRFIKFINDYS